VKAALFDPALDGLLERARPLLAAVLDGRRGGRNFAGGSGVLLGGGLVLTNAHVAHGGQHLRVILTSDEAHDARQAASEPELDLALLEIPVDGGAAAVLASAPPRVGELVFALGHPWGQRNVLTAGVLSAVTSLRTPHGDIPALRADLLLAPGNSGGPLLNAAGEVLGLNAMVFGGDQSVAIPASVIRGFLERARRERVPQGVL
jgi:serine protease Do